MTTERTGTSPADSEPTTDQAGTEAAAAVLDLDGVPETLLWPLWNRACETKRDDALIEDPWSVQLVETIAYDFRGHFGKPSPFHPIRARVGDDLLRAYHARLGERATAVALGVGLDSQRQRTGFPVSQWISVDLPESLEVRKTLLPDTAEERMIPCSALDARWMDAVESAHPPFISAMGLLMYFKRPDVRDLLVRIGRTFPGAEIFFDTIPAFISKKTLRGLKVTKKYTAPPMPWGIAVTQLADFLEDAGLSPLTVQTYAEPFPERMRLYWLLGKIRPIRAALAGGLAHARCEGS